MKQTGGSSNNVQILLISVLSNSSAFLLAPLESLLSMFALLPSDIFASAFAAAMTSVGGYFSGMTTSTPARLLMTFGLSFGAGVEVRVLPKTLRALRALANSRLSFLAANDLRSARS